jgi:pyruvate/2-oxoglutarate dehydrogenase complex dihydrolipoamide dehydrogenase (E3) component
VTDIFREALPSGIEAVVLGTSWEGAETALTLVAAGNRVVCLEEDRKFGQRLSPVTRRWYLRQRLEEAGVKIVCGVRNVSMASGRVCWSTDEGDDMASCDLLVYEGIRVPRPIPAISSSIRTVVIGDAVQPATAMEAIRSGFEAALSIE